MDRPSPLPPLLNLTPDSNGAEVGLADIVLLNLPVPLYSAAYLKQPSGCTLQENPVCRRHRASDPYPRTLLLQRHHPANVLLVALLPQVQQRSVTRRLSNRAKRCVLTGKHQRKHRRSNDRPAEILLMQSYVALLQTDARISEHSSVYEVSGTDLNRVRAPSTAKVSTKMLLNMTLVSTRRSSRISIGLPTTHR